MELSFINCSLYYINIFIKIILFNYKNSILFSKIIINKIMEIEQEIKNDDVKLENLNDPNTEKFLFLVTPEKIDTECIGGISLKNGVRILSVIVFYEALSSLEGILDSKYYSKFIFSLLFLIFYLIIGCLALYSTFKDDLYSARISYIILCIIFIIEGLFYLLKCTIRLIEFINPWDGGFLKLKTIIFILGKIAYLFIFLYFIYILYCYIISLKKLN